MKTIKEKFASIKDKIAKERYTTPFRLKVLIIVCWIAYIICLIIKLCGGNRFEIATSNETFIAICDYIDNTLWLKMMIACINFIIVGSIIILAILKQLFYKWYQALLFIPLMITASIVGWYNSIINSILSFVIYLLPIIFIPKQWYRAIVGTCLLILFQFISLITKNVNEIYLNNESTLVSIILQIDVIILSLIYYLYANARKEIKN